MRVLHSAMKTQNGRSIAVNAANDMYFSYSSACEGNKVVLQRSATCVPYRSINCSMRINMGTVTCCNLCSSKRIHL